MKNEIKKDKQIKKFCLYGFLKNLKFFEPYLIIYLLSKGLNLFEIGLLISIRELIVNIFEIPSGFFADFFGRKKELYLCFVFYILSFIFFFLANSFIIAAFAMVFFGLGEAFRSGTHKAMIYTYLDHKQWQSEKIFVYGRTRSFSLVGSAVSSLIAILLILIIPNDNYIFLFSLFPYLLALLLIFTYPKFLDLKDKKQNISFSSMVKDFLNSFKLNRNMRNLLIEEGMAEAIYSYVKDLIQPLLELIIIGSGIVLLSSLSTEDNLKILLGLIYAVLNLTGAYFSKKTYIIKGNKSSIYCLKLIHIALAVVCTVLAFLSANYLIVCFMYVAIYILHSIRKPLFVDEIDTHIDKSNRATSISTSSGIKSMFLIVFAPVLGYLADNYSINMAFLVIAIVLFISTSLLKLNKTR